MTGPILSVLQRAATLYRSDPTLSVAAAMSDTWNARPRCALWEPAVYTDALAELEAALGTSKTWGLTREQVMAGFDAAIDKMRSAA